MLADAPASERLAETIATPRPSRQLAAPGATILIVDDERVSLAVLGRLLKQSSYHTILAASGQEAMDALRQQRVDLVLLDIVMPLMDGRELLHWIRLQWDEAQLPVVMLTAADDRRQIISVLEAGANDYVTKPYDLEVLRARVDVQLKLKSAQTAVRRSEERYALAAQATKDGLWDWDLMSNQLYCSPRWNQIVGLPEREATGAPDRWWRRVHSDDLDGLRDIIAKGSDGCSPPFETEFRIQHEDGDARWALCRGVFVYDADGRCQRIAGSLSDITGGKVADALTGLPSRQLFTERVERQLAECRCTPSAGCAVLYIDLDNFKFINDSLGHAAGDEVLRTTARRLELALREQDGIAARLGGDEFAVLLESATPPHELVNFAEELLQALRTPIIIDGREMQVRASVGIATWSVEVETVDQLLRRADAAMYDAKTQGKAQASVYAPALLTRAESRLRVEAALQTALDQQQFTLRYHPIISLQDGRLLAFETLVRWQHPENGLISPADFIPIAEETGLIIPLGDWILRNACRQLASWIQRFPQHRKLKLGVNVAYPQLAQPQFVESVLQALRDAGLSGANLKLELTESLLMRDPLRAASTLQTLRGHGIEVAIDDFGCGFSSLAMLQQLPLDMLKIDRSFIERLDDPRTGRPIVNTILTLAENLQLAVVAEGVETAWHCAELRRLGCDYAQGFYFAKPLTADDAAAYLETATTVSSESNTKSSDNTQR